MDMEILKELKARSDAQLAFMPDLLAKGMSTIQALIVSGDMVSAASATKMVEQGTPAIKAVHYVGSYCRFDWAVKHLTTEEIFPILPELWMGADPDDTNPEYLELWRKAYAANGNKMMLDGEPLPGGKLINVHRGQVGNAKGFAWTTDRLVAEKFAKTGGQRIQVVGGRVLTKRVPRSQILAFITGRGEREVILND